MRTSRFTHFLSQVAVAVPGCGVFFYQSAAQTQLARGYEGAVFIPVIHTDWNVPVPMSAVLETFPRPAERSTLVILVQTPQLHLPRSLTDSRDKQLVQCQSREIKTCKDSRFLVSMYDPFVFIVLRSQKLC
jgi:hypothetical protein